MIKLHNQYVRLIYIKPHRHDYVVNVTRSDVSRRSHALRGLTTNAITAPPGLRSDRERFVGLNLLRHYVVTFRFLRR